MAIDQEYLKEVLNYCPDTGVFTWLKSLSKKTKIGSAAGTLMSTGYVQIKINGKLYKSYHLAWLYMTGELVKDQIDHVNRCRSDDRFDNLREATRSQNQGNRKKRIDGSSKYKGVGWCKKSNKWRARITLNSKEKILGYFQSEEDAAFAYDKAAISQWGNFSHLNFAGIQLDA